MEKENYPFSLSNHEGVYSLLLTDMKWDLFEQNNYLGNGHDWDRLINNLLKDQATELLEQLSFDSEADMFCVRSNDESVLKKVSSIVSQFYDNDEKLSEMIVKYAKYS